MAGGHAHWHSRAREARGPARPPPLAHGRGGVQGAVARKGQAVRCACVCSLPDSGATGARPTHRPPGPGYGHDPPRAAAWRCWRGAPGQPIAPAASARRPALAAPRSPTLRPLDRPGLQGHGEEHPDRPTPARHPARATRWTSRAQPWSRPPPPWPQQTRAPAQAPPRRACARHPPPELPRPRPQRQRDPPGRPSGCHAHRESSHGRLRTRWHRPRVWRARTRGSPPWRPWRPST